MSIDPRDRAGGGHLPGKKSRIAKGDHLEADPLERNPRTQNGERDHNHDQGVESC